MASLDTGKILFEHDSDKLMIPASNAKLFTGALALDRLGADCRIETSIAVTLFNERLVFSVMLNSYKDPSGIHTPREETDALVRMLVQ